MPRLPWPDGLTAPHRRRDPRGRTRTHPHARSINCQVYNDTVCALWSMSRGRSALPGVVPGHCDGGWSRRGARAPRPKGAVLQRQRAPCMVCRRSDLRVGRGSRCCVPGALTCLHVPATVPRPPGRSPMPLATVCHDPSWTDLRAQGAVAWSCSSLHAGPAL